MAATKDQMQASIAPGSTEYGDRATLEQNIPTQRPDPTLAPGGAGTAPGVQAAPQGGLEMLLSGAIPSDPMLPQTAGLPHGPGAGPPLDQAETPLSTYTERLRDVADNAKSPRLRAQARAGLKLLYQRGAL